MEYIKVGKNYMIKGSNGIVISEKEKLELENKELIIKDIESNECQGKTTQKIEKNKKKIKEIMEEERKQKVIDIETYDKKDTAPIKKEVGVDDIIEETDKSI